MSSVFQGVGHSVKIAAKDVAVTAVTTDTNPVAANKEVATL